MKENLTLIQKNVKKILISYPYLRDTDRGIVWQYWKDIDLAIITDGEYLTKSIPETDFKKRCTTYSSIERAARKIREIFPELKGAKQVERERIRKEKEYRNSFGHQKNLDTDPWE